MKKHKRSIFLCVAGAALLCSSASWADDTQPSGTTSTPGTGNGASTTPMPSTGNGTSGTVSTPSTGYGASTTTTTAASYEGVPAERVEEKRPLPNTPMLITGATLFGAAYIPSVIVAAASPNQDDNNYLWIPVAGPWIDLAVRDCGASCTAPDTWNAVGLVASGVAQAGGLALTIASYLVREQPSPTTVGTAVPANKQAAKKPQLRVTPISVRAGAGIGAVGTF